MLKFVGGAEHKGFFLQQSFEADGRILVLTGKNGVGKTRFLESIIEGKSETYCAGDKVERANMVFLAQSSLVPSFGQIIDDASYVLRVDRTVDYFVRCKKDFVDPYDLSKSGLGMMHSRGLDSNPGLSYSKLYELCQIISKKLNIPVSELDGENIRVNYSDILDTPLGVSNLSLISNSYMRRIYENEFNSWRASKRNKKISFIDVDKISEVFGPEPWSLINSILKSVFDDKFIISVPDEEYEVFDYVAQLKLQGSEEFISPESLSSGERTLLWLALTLFNTQYQNTLTSSIPKLLLIDEPDAFLHPKMVEKLYTVLSLFTTIFGTYVIITTHSPTTVALAPDKSVYVVCDGDVKPVEKDLAISDLLDGVDQISIDPENRLHVFVESLYDANLYSALYTYLRGTENAIDSKVSLSFTPSGEKVPISRIVEAMKSLVSSDEELISNVVAAINGVGSCAHVYGAVNSFTDPSSKYVRGVVDWDLKNKPEPGVIVFAKDYAYTTENVALDPISILLLLHMDKESEYSIFNLCGENVSWTDWMGRPDLLQISLDRYLERILGCQNSKDAELTYISGVQLRTDKQYLLMGEGLEKRVIAAYNGLKSYIGNGPKKDLKYTVVTKSMLKMSGGRFIPIQFAHLFKELQLSRRR
ncbi:ATP-binding protein [Pseudomonas sp. G5001]|uniref:ATP-binding protein n=1 Tax=Pseudomonas sp. G5001 TaxID=2738824 RepID=UPI0015A4732C|nr:ATP-binding protein [Pseudomonas sp. G5001]NWB72591.1 ATP-binding protein [Pseudomonas sp. G5001]